jgi:hypothetical protein
MVFKLLKISRVILMFKTGLKPKSMKIT